MKLVIQPSIWYFGSGLILFLMLSVVISQFSIGEIHFYTVRTGSMGRSLPQGSMFITKKSSRYVKGDIITYIQNETVITHRVFAVIAEKNTHLYKTKGDSNPIIDTYLVSEKDVIGKVSFYIPFLGNGVLWAKTILGFIVLVLAPALVIITYEIIYLHKKGETLKILL